MANLVSTLLKLTSKADFKISFCTELITKNKNDSIASTIYLIIHSLNEQRNLKIKWLDNKKNNIILTYGYGNVWQTSYEINANWFKRSFKQNVMTNIFKTGIPLLRNPPAV